MGLRSIENRVKDEFILVMNQNELEMRVLYAQKSSQLQSQIKHRLGNAVPWRHDFIVHHLGLVGLIDVGQRVIKPIFDSLVGKTAQKFGALALIPNVKGPERAGVKVRTRYGGDASQLSDIVRATLMFKIRPKVIADIYAAIEEIVFMSELNGVRASVIVLVFRIKLPIITNRRNGDHKQ